MILKASILSVVVPASVPPRMVDVSIQRPGENIQAVYSPGTRGHGSGERNGMAFGVAGCGHPQGFKRAPVLAIPPLVEQIAPGPSHKDINALRPRATRGRRSRQRRGDVHGGIEIVLHFRQSHGGEFGTACPNGRGAAGSRRACRSSLRSVPPRCPRSPRPAFPPRISASPGSSPGPRGAEMRSERTLVSCLCMSPYR